MIQQRVAGVRELVAGMLLALVSGTLCAQDKAVVFAAASLANAMSEASTQFEKDSGIKVVHSFASSASLAKQIEAGAPAGVFVSANAKWMNYLESRNRIDTASRRNWLGNRLVLVVPAGKAFTVKFEPGYDLAAAFEGRLCTGNVESVPAGIYARQALNSLGWWNGIKRRIVGTEDVRAALAFVARGECTAGIAYESDARISDKVEIAAVFPENSHEPVVYSLALVSAGNAAREYWKFLQGPAVAPIFERHGFRVLK
jgi:molybdate transport system substrate-binding protein